MSGFLESFSDSFMVAILAWPFVALALSLPVFLIQYIRFHRLPIGRVITIYLLFLYILALVAFTLYPLPDDPAKFCATRHLVPQLDIFRFITDIKVDGLRAVAQIVANIAFFFPLGIFMRNLAGKKMFITVLTATLVSLTIEVAQLTGVFGIFPCSYRLFDVDDIVFNIFGAVIGFLAAFVLPNLSKPKKRETINTNPGIVQRFVVFVADYMLGGVLALMLVIPMYFMNGPWRDWQFPLQLTCFVILQFIVPILWKGKTVFGALTGVSLDDKERGKLNRLLLYAARAALLGCIVLTNGAAFVGVAVLLSWIIFRKMPYRIVDIFFRKK